MTEPSPPLGIDGPRRRAPSAWALPLACCAWAIALLVAAVAGVELGIRMRGVHRMELGEAGPDAFDLARSEIAAAVLWLSAALAVVGAMVVLGVLRRFGVRAPRSPAELVGTCILWTVTGLVLALSMLVVVLFGVFAPALSG